ncbi:TetR/AcrR family transcriptional regulator [Phenylobacterium sp.]|uniref:TetR/AcrR family transcriptional regulator n=1 Tax=Phenylobacterium sp. TaxID=1871053 RepID=UPI0025D18D97|nr:TetR/AcrR family transcriptional regulator [Phenylobacterium sp.]
MAKATPKRPWGEGIQDRGEQYELKRQVVLRTAARIYTQRGFHETTLTDIAEALNISKPTLYYYFRSKDEILFECHRLGIEAITDGETPMPPPGEGTARERLHEFLRRYVRMVVDDFGTCLVMTGANALGPENRAEVVGGRRQIDGMLRGILEEGARDGTIVCDDIMLTSMFIFGAMNWIPHWFHREGEINVDTLSVRLVAFVDRALLSAPQ